MALHIDTFNNIRGGNSLYKALVHPLAAEQGGTLIARIAAAGPVTIYDPRDCMAAFAELYDVSGWDVAGVYVQRVESLGTTVLGHAVQPVTALKAATFNTLFVAAFDAERVVAHIRHLLPTEVEVVTLDALRLPVAMLTQPRNYLDPLNFATNLALFRDQDGHHTSVASANYWQGYGAKDTRLWLRLFDAQGQVLAQWEQPLAASGGTYQIDSREVRARFNLPEFTGTLFIHAINVAGHDVVKYALDTYGDTPEVLSCTHDANAWPSDYYAGLPAPQADEQVLLWIQNSSPVTIPAGGVGINRMGSDDIIGFDEAIPPYGTRAVDVGQLLPNVRWPEQLEVAAGKYCVRPRYEIFKHGGRSRMAHVNVERGDLTPDAQLPAVMASGVIGAGYILPAPLLPTGEFRTLVLPTPMARGQSELPLALVVRDAGGAEILRYRFGCIPRRESVAIDVNELLAKQGKRLPAGYGHVEVVYDFSTGGGADGWLHGLFRYEQLASGHSAETSFGAHIYNIPVTYRNEPQSYVGAPPGLSTRLFLRLGTDPLDTLCHLVYAASLPWHVQSNTTLTLYDALGNEVARRDVAIPCHGSLLWRYHAMFDAAARQRAGAGAYVMIRDTTCRLFGYHGLVNGTTAFSLDHMFGF